MARTSALVRRCRADLHIHTALSPCAELEMLPDLIVMKAAAEGLDLIAICDHNSAENTAACIEAARGTPVRVLAGIECESREGVHVLGLFDGAESAGALQGFLWERLPDEPNRPEFFGAQMVVSAQGEFVRYNERLLATGADASVEELIAKIRSLGGLALPAHVDKTYAGLLGVLGLVPEGVRLEGVEVSGRADARDVRERFPQIAKLPFLRASDAHRLSEIGQAHTRVWLEHRTVGELKLALSGLDGRHLEDN